MARLEKWAESAIRTVDERGDGTHRIRLVTADGSTWQTWEAPFPPVEQWVQEAESLCAELREDFSGPVSAMFVAESASGTIRSQCPRQIQGTQKRGAGVGAFGGPGAPLQDMYAAQAKTTERTLQSANVQLEVLTRTVESQARANSELLDYIRAQNEHSAMQRLEQTSEVQQILGQLMDQAPLLLELLKTRIKSPGKPAAAAVGNHVADAVRDVAVNAASSGAAKLTESLLTKGN